MVCIVVRTDAQCNLARHGFQPLLEYTNWPLLPSPSFPSHSSTYSCACISFFNGLGGHKRHWVVVLHQKARPVANHYFAQHLAVVCFAKHHSRGRLQPTDIGTIGIVAVVSSYNAPVPKDKAADTTQLYSKICAQSHKGRGRVVTVRTIIVESCFWAHSEPMKKLLHPSPHK